MNSGNLAICFGPTLMGSNLSPNIADAGWQVRVIDTILQNCFSIFVGFLLATHPTVDVSSDADYRLYRMMTEELQTCFGWFLCRAFPLPYRCASVLVKTNTRPSIRDCILCPLFFLNGPLL